jgi:3',5'-cyclic AMP phosphodiesterase CpdA
MLENDLYFPQYARYEKRLSEKKNRKIHKRIVIISDTHISDLSNNQFNPIIFRKAMNEIHLIKNVDYYLHLGDVTAEGTYLDYQYAVDFLHSLRLKPNFYCIPGNHDERNVGDLLFQEMIGPREFFVEDNDLYMMGLDSSIPDQDGGHIGYNHIRECMKSFSPQDDKVQILCFHHQLFPIPHTGRERSAIIDGGDVMNLALEADLDFILNGHRHITNLYTLTDGNAELSVFNAGTLSCNKTRYRELFSYSILDIDDHIAKFQTHSILDNQFNQRNRYLHRMFQTNIPNKGYKQVLLVHIGNTHFNEDHMMKDVFNKAALQIAQLTPTAVIHTGSITHKNTPEDYTLAIQHLKTFKAPVIALPGSRDMGDYGWDAYLDYDHEFKQSLSTPNVNIYGINAFDPHISDGKVGRTTITQLTEMFSKKFQGQYHIIALNHRLITPPRLKFDDVIADAGDVLSEFTKPENSIDLILLGRSNVAYAVQFEDTIICTCGSICSHHPHDLNRHSFNSISIYDTGFVEIREHLIESEKVKLIGQFWIKNRFEKQNIDQK